MRDALIITPAEPGAKSGNRVTALRWAKRLRELDRRVRIATGYAGEPCDVMVALHAHKSHAALVAHARAHPDTPRVLALTGTDLYGDLDADGARESIALAHRLIVLQPLGLARLAGADRRKARVIRQSARPARVVAQPSFVACVLAHMRDVKDPLLAADALARLPDSAIRISHLGGADEAWRARAIAMEEALHGRWRWLGAQSRQATLAMLASSTLLVLTSRSEGGANVVTEAIAAGVPVVSTRIDGSLGILGDDYPGYCDVGDAAGLAALLDRCERDGEFLGELRRRVIALQPLVDPARERESWATVLAEL